MTEHLEACTGLTTPKPATARYVRLLIQGGPAYWLHVEARATATLQHLDAFLRRTWVECCGHLSAFLIGDRRLALRLVDDAREGGPVEEPMDYALGEVLHEGTRARYEYDLGTPTTLNIQGLGTVIRPPRRTPVRLMARNDPPGIPCGRCGGSARRVCPGCSHRPDGWFCPTCERKHECPYEVVLPIVNSPRTGTCGYGLTGRPAAGRA